jgi:hypothetical protein
VKSTNAPVARTVIVNEAFVRGLIHCGIASPLGARLRYSSQSGVSAAEPPFEIVGVVKDLGLDPGEQGDEAAYVFHAASAATVSPLVMSVRARQSIDIDTGSASAGNCRGCRYRIVPAGSPLTRRIDLGAGPLMVAPVVAVGGVSALGLFLSAMGLFALMPGSA